MARKAQSTASKKVDKTMNERKEGTLRSGKGGKKVTSRKQAIAIGLSEARKQGAKVPKKRVSSFRQRCACRPTFRRRCQLLAHQSSCSIATKSHPVFETQGAHHG